MLEAFVALSLAGNVVQFVDFGIRAIKSVRDLYKSADGTLSDLSGMEKDAIGQAQYFEVILSGPLKDEDAELSKLAAACASLSKELVDVLRTLQIDPQKNTLIEAASKSFKAHLAKSQLKDLERGLLKTRDAICTRLLILLSEQQVDVGPRLKDLAQLTESTNLQTQRTLEAAVSRLIHTVELKTWNRGEDDKFTSFSTDLKGFIIDNQNSKRVLRILQSLHFRQLRERQSGVHQAHKNTFEWIYGAQSSANFSPWLQMESGIYWIEGKPGSGKSTLMKFLLSNGRTLTLLRQWAGSKNLVIANHFFWSAGTPLQKSQAGLLRTLLFQIFSHCPEIVSEVCPNRWADDSPSWIEEWDWIELFEAFKRIASLEHLPIKICLFIDGLDEYDGDHVELVEILRTMAKSEHIKICASSRPWYDFIDAFGGQKWKLSVQDLTANDILLYVKDNLEQNTRFQKLKHRDTLAATKLVEEIRTRSFGVFLWVYLVIRSLLRGLRNVDKISDLRQRLYELPVELEKYFELMLDSIEKVYQQTTARIFKVMISAQGPLPIIVFHFLDQEESRPAYALHGFKPVLRHELNTLLDEKKRQLHANCRDLLWVSSHSSNERGILIDRVSFLHRTVIDFLQTKNMDSPLSTQAGKSFRPTTSLTMMYLAMLKTHARYYGDNLDITHSLVLGVIFYARESEKEVEISEEAALDELESFTQKQLINWKKLSHIYDCSNFAGYVVRAKLQHYLRRKTLQNRESDWAGSGLLQHALRARFTIEQDVYFTSRIEAKVDLSMLQSLLDLGISPNEEIPESSEPNQLKPVKSVWYGFLLTLMENFPKEARDPTWDMSNHLIPEDELSQSVEDDDVLSGARGLKHKWLPNWYEACEIMISHGANEILHTYTYGDKDQKPHQIHAK